MKPLAQRIEEELRIFQHQGAGNVPIAKILAECLEALEHHDLQLTEVISTANKYLERARRAEARARDLESQAADRSKSDDLAKNLYRIQTGRDPLDHTDLCCTMMKIVDTICDAELARIEREMPHG